MSRGGTEGDDNTNSSSSDDIDRANELVQRFTDEAVYSVMLRSAPQQVPGPDGEYPHPDCEDCGDPIIPERLKMGRIRCVECQERVERWAR